jgi:hypothetical protein
MKLQPNEFQKAMENVSFYSTMIIRKSESGETSVTVTKQDLFDYVADIEKKLVLLAHKVAENL